MSSREDRFKAPIMEYLNKGEYENGTSFSRGNLPARENVRDWLEKNFQIKTNRNFRVILVEDLGNYKVLIQTPDGKSFADFNVWYAFFNNGNFSDVNFPKHDYMFEWYKRIKQIENGVLQAVEKLIKEREDPETIVSIYSNSIKEELHKFLATLKWICLQEDANYPPPKMGSTYTLAPYVLLDYGFAPSDMRKLLKF